MSRVLIVTFCFVVISIAAATMMLAHGGKDGDSTALDRLSSVTLALNGPIENAQLPGLLEPDDRIPATETVQQDPVDQAPAAGSTLGVLALATSQDTGDVTDYRGAAEPRVDATPRPSGRIMDDLGLATSVPSGPMVDRPNQLPSRAADVGTPFGLRDGPTDIRGVDREDDRHDGRADNQLASLRPDAPETGVVLRPTPPLDQNGYVESVSLPSSSAAVDSDADEAVAALPLPGAPVAATPVPAAPDPRVREAQRLLNSLGYNPGPADGVNGPRTRSAVRTYQATAGYYASGEITPMLVADLRRAYAATGRAATETRQPTKVRASSAPARPARKADAEPGVLASLTSLVGRFQQMTGRELNSRSNPAGMDRYCLSNPTTWIYDSGIGDLIHCNRWLSDRQLLTTADNADLVGGNTRCTGRGDCRATGGGGH